MKYFYLTLFRRTFKSANLANLYFERLFILFEGRIVYSQVEKNSLFYFIDLKFE
jgi:hypothetical protein